MRYFPHNEKGDDFCYSYKRSDVIYEILEEGLKELMSVGEVKATDEFNRLRIRKTPKVSIGVSISNGILDLDIQTDDMDTEPQKCNFQIVIHHTGNMHCILSYII